MEGSEASTIYCFLESLWNADEQGQLADTRFVVELGGRGRPQHYAVSNVQEAKHKVSELVVMGTGAYFAPARFGSDHKRTKVNALGAHCLWLDVDCGKSKAANGDGYATQKEALRELKKACKKLSLPKPSIVVNSGSGLHVYWSFDEFIEKTHWLNLAESLKVALKQVGFLADPSRTADIASLLRVPGTKNFKDRSNPKPVEILYFGSSRELRSIERSLQKISTTRSNVVQWPKAPEFLLARTQSHRIREFRAKIKPLNLGDSLFPFEKLEETPENIKRVEDALSYLSPVETKFWIDMILAVASLGWECGLSLLEEWSKRSEKHWETEQKSTKAKEGLTKIYNTYDSSRSDAISIGSLFRNAKEAGWPDSQIFADAFSKNGSDGATDTNQFPLYTVDELNELSPLEWRVKNLLPKSGLAAVYGPSGSGKSFLVLDLLCHVALGEDYFGHRVKEPCSVVYVALEGALGISSRINAWESNQNKKLPESFLVMPGSLSLLNEDSDSFASTLIERGLNGGVIVIDTLNQSAPTADENASQDMGKIISNAQRLAKKTDSLVILVHHTGKDQSKGLRGHSSLHAALDVAIEVQNTKQGREWRTSKLKDGEIGNQFPFRLEPVRLGTDGDGDPLTSCVVVSDSKRKHRPSEPNGKNQKILLEALRARYGEGEVISCDATIAIGAEALSHRGASHSKSAAKEVVSGLIKNGNLIECEGGYELC